MHEDPECQIMVKKVVVNFYRRYGGCHRTDDQETRNMNTKTAGHHCRWKPSAHFEHDVAIIDGKPEILSTLLTFIKNWNCEQ
jgi:uncharacterized ParB-like nuclease family protein